MLAESILDLTALWNPPPTEAGVLGRISSVINGTTSYITSLETAFQLKMPNSAAPVIQDKIKKRQVDTNVKYRNSLVQ
jgi:hypothetical protein